MTDKQITKIKKSRGLIKAQVTRAYNWIRAFDIQAQDIEEVEVRLAAIERTWLEFREKQDELEELDAAFENDGEREAFENDYYAASAAARALIASRQRSRMLEINQNPQIAVLNAGNGANPMDQIKLPPISLPSFNGSYDQWPNFRDTFKAVIDENGSLSDIKKLYYLRLALKGVAAEIVSSLEMSANNYEVAWQLLESRFENKRVLVHHHVQALIDFPAIQKESHSALRQLLDTTEKHVRALKKLGEPTDTWSTILVHLMTAKLDAASKREWETKSSTKNVPTYNQFIDFTTSRCIMLETLQLDKPRAAKPSGSSNESKSNSSNKKTIVAVSTEVRTDNCLLCAEGEHRIYHCPAFLNLTPQGRSKEARRLKLCLNCLKGGHTLEACNFGTCRLCHKKHNTLLHFNKVDSTSSTPQDNRGANSPNASQPTNDSQTTSLVHCAVRPSDRGLLATAIIKIQGITGEFHECRAFLDPGSQSNFITRDLCDRLQLSQHKNYLTIRGIDNTRTTALTGTHATIQSKVNAFKVKLSFSVLPEITTRLPLVDIDKRNLKIPENITLADPSFHISGKIDVLLGSSVFWDLLCIGQIKLGKSQPVAQKTKLGWIIAGPIGFESKVKSSIASACFFSNTSMVEDQLERFWHVEEGAPYTEPSEDDKICEEEFTRTHQRDSEGRFEVRLPLRGNVERLGASREIAIKRLKSMEKKFAKTQELQERYTKFMQEYQDMGHMTEVANDEGNEVINYLPHHSVVKEDSLTTKLRVVFDASCSTSSGIALNDIIRVGPTIQQDLLHILLRFRQHRYVITADIQKMYRQVLLQKDQRDLQRVVWRNDPSAPIRDYRLNTVTYGLASAPFLAIRCLIQLSIESREKYPEASEMICNDFYVDDLLSGGDDVPTLRRLKSELIEILNSAGFTLHKWNTNEPSILDVSSESTTLPIGDEIKTLGVVWNTIDDCLQYRTQAVTKSRHATKRSVLSTIAQIYDPLGLMGPTIICAKIILQQLWQLKIGWDESLPLDLHTTWMRYQDQIDDMSLISIPRHVISTEPQSIEMHGFCDASEAAYGACVYLRSLSESGQVSVHLLCAKSKVAPLKRVTLPRLELCGALLLTKLGQTVQRALSIRLDSIHYWSDSTITLAWIKHRPEELQTFVANRVADIQRNAPEAHWSHVRSKDNPADVISRGTTPEKLKESRLWWFGPTWLAKNAREWPIELDPEPETVPEIKKQTVVSHCVPSSDGILAKFSSFSRLKRVVAFCLRFKTNALKKQSQRTGPLSVEELKIATSAIVKMAQSDEFESEKAALQANREIHNKSKLVALNPFIDSEGIIRVGGRLRHADIDYSRRHPIILPAKHPVTESIIRDTHLKQLHTGPQGLLAHLRQLYWPLSGRQAVRRVLRNCVVCFRVRPTVKNQLMGDLPESRVNPARVFLNSGLDYAGPFNIKISRNKTGKAYLCIFVCFATKATHLEVVSDLSTTAFLNALKRFIARRGRCAKLFSDNGSNFIGANNELKALANMIKTEHDKIERFLADQSIQWAFIPPYSPHMGGLWEAAVKSAKTHLKKVVGNTSLTFEELGTIFAQIEAVLNSRPLCPVSNEPQDYEVLTPGHFIIGEPLNSFPEPDLSDVPTNRLTRFQLLSQIRQNFWTSWSRDYLTQLQNRYKWQKPNNETIKVNALVLLKDNDLPPLKWRLARIIETHAGDDKLVRVVSVKTSSGITKRATNKICVLPIEG